MYYKIKKKKKQRKKKIKEMHSKKKKKKKRKVNDGGIRKSKTYAFPQIHESTPTYPAVPPEEELRAD